MDSRIIYYSTQIMEIVFSVVLSRFGDQTILNSSPGDRFAYGYTKFGPFWWFELSGAAKINVDFWIVAKNVMYLLFLCLFFGSQKAGNKRKPLPIITVLCMQSMVSIGFMHATIWPKHFLTLGLKLLTKVASDPPYFGGMKSRGYVQVGYVHHVDDPFLLQPLDHVPFP